MRWLFSMLIGLVIAAVASVSPASAAPLDVSAYWERFADVVPGLSSDLKELKTRDVTALERSPLRIRGQAKLLDQLPSGATLMDHGNQGFISASVTRDEGTSVQHLILIESKSTTTKFHFDTDGDLTIGTDGMISVVAADGTKWFIVPPWALDAKGKPVPTGYEIDGSTLIQTVLHQSDEYTYPIVADPFAGFALFKNFHKDTYNGDVRYNAALTAAGVALWLSTPIPPLSGFVNGPDLLRNHGWPEWVAKWPAITNKPTLAQQYDCHALGAPFTGEEFNLERFRSNKANWFPTVAFHKCNW